MRTPETSWFLLLGALVALGGCPTQGVDDDDDSTDPADDDDSAVGDDDDSTDGFPASPFPFSIDVAGASNETVTVDMETGCQNFNGSSNFRQQMSAGGWVLRIAVDGTYAGAGVYEASQGASLTLQNNVAGGAFYQANAASGDAVTVEMLGDDGLRAWGTVTVSGMTQNGAGTVTLNPNVLPIWCDDITH
jgi:hypothetical protein